MGGAFRGCEQVMQCGSPPRLSRSESDLDFKSFDVGNAGRCVSPRHLAVGDGDATVTNRIRQLVQK
jgi:hypothetical protein